MLVTDQVATLNQSTGLIEYQKPRKIYHYPDFEGEMYHVSGDNIDLNVTSNHRMYCSLYDSATDVWSPYKLVNVSNLKKSIG